MKSNEKYSFLYLYIIYILFQLLWKPFCNRNYLMEEWNTFWGSLLIQLGKIRYTDLGGYNGRTTPSGFDPSMFCGVDETFESSFVGVKSLDSFILQYYYILLQLLHFRVFSLYNLFTCRIIFILCHTFYIILINEKYLIQDNNVLEHKQTTTNL